MKIHKVSYANKPLNILLTDELTCPFQPSAYRGNGTEERFGIVMKAPDDLYQVFAGIEARCRGLLRLDNLKKLEKKVYSIHTYILLDITIKYTLLKFFSSCYA